jgi:hypothetical protein
MTGKSGKDYSQSNKQPGFSILSIAKLGSVAAANRDFQLGSFFPQLIVKPEVFPS